MQSQEDRENLSYSQQNVLANSIRIARQKLSRVVEEDIMGMQQDRERKQNQTFSKSRGSAAKESSAAQAIKALHIRIAQLEAFNATLTKETAQAKRELNLKNLQLQSFRSEHAEHIDKISQLKDKLGKNDKNLKQKQLEIQQLKQFLKEKQTHYKESLAQFQNKWEQQKKLKQALQDKIKQLNKRIDNNQKVIVQMIRELEQQKNKNNSNVKVANNNGAFNSPHVDAWTRSTNNFIQQVHKYSKSSKSKEYGDFPVIVDEPDGEGQQRQRYRERLASGKKVKAPEGPSQPKNKPKTTKKSQRILTSDQLAKELQQKNRQLYTMLRTSDRKCREQQKMKNQYKDRFYSLKNVMDLIIEEINRLPNNLSHKFKCLIVKAKKIENDNLECLRSFSNLHRNGEKRRFRSKSSRNSSKESSAGSKNREKQLKMQDLNLSDHNMSQTRSHSKSKRRSLANYLRNSSAKKNTQAVLKQMQGLGQKSKQNIYQSEQIRTLTRKIREQRKQLSQLYKRAKQEADPQRQQALKNQFEKKMAQNVLLQTELQTLKHTSKQ